MNRYISYLTRYPKTLVATLLLGYPIANILYLHWSLSRTIQHEGPKRLTRVSKNNMSSIPEEAFSADYIMVHDCAHRSISASKIPDLGLDDLINLYLKHTLSLFSHLPQAYLLKTISSPTERKTFQESYISTLDFKPGDQVHGIYRVVARSEGRVEFEVKPMGVVKGGRLVISVERVGEELRFRSETVMWKGVGEGGLMPLERGVLRFMHEIASWGLLRSGTRYLVSMKGKESDI